jgi:hypothetical protein
MECGPDRPRNKAGIISDPMSVSNLPPLSSPHPHGWGTQLASTGKLPINGPHQEDFS